MSSNKCLVTLALAAVIVVVWATASMGETFTWIGQGAEGEWDEQTNWDPEGVPDGDDDVIHDGSGAGVIIVREVGTACNSFTATAGGSPARGLRVLADVPHSINPTLTVGPSQGVGSFTVNSQTDEVRYLTQVGFGSRFAANGEIDGGDWEIGPHAVLEYNAGEMHFRNGVWRLIGGKFNSTEAEDNFGFPDESGKIIVESGGAWHSLHSFVYVDEIEVKSGGVFWAARPRPEVKIVNDGGYFASFDTTVSPELEDPVEVRFANGARSRPFGPESDAGFAVRYFIGTGHSLVYEGDGNELRVNKVGLIDPNDVGGGVIRSDGVGAALRLGLYEALDIQTQGAAFKDWDSRGVTLAAAEGPTEDGCDPNTVTVRTVEAHYPDLGCVFFEDVPCNHWAQLYVETGATLKIVDDHVNAHRGDPNDPAAERDAVYVRGSVVIEQHALLDVNGLKVYHAGAVADRLETLVTGAGETGGLIPVRALKYGDFDGDCDVDLDDYGVLNDFITSPGTPTVFPLGDADCDTDVDSTDFAKYSQNFTGSVNACEPCNGQQESASSGGPDLEDLAEAMQASLSCEEIQAALSAYGLLLQTMADPTARSQLEDLIALLEE